LGNIFQQANSTFEQQIETATTIGYFEIHIKYIGTNNTISIGATSKSILPQNPVTFPGEFEQSIGMNLNSGRIKFEKSNHTYYGLVGTVGSSVGIGILNTGHVFFTINGIFLPVIPEFVFDFNSDIYPVIGIQGKGTNVHLREYTKPDIHARFKTFDLTKVPKLKMMQVAQPSAIQHNGSPIGAVPAGKHQKPKVFMMPVMDHHHAHRKPKQAAALPQVQQQLPAIQHQQVVPMQINLPQAFPFGIQCNVSGEHTIAIFFKETSDSISSTVYHIEIEKEIENGRWVPISKTITFATAPVVLHKTNTSVISLRFRALFMNNTMSEWVCKLFTFDEVSMKVDGNHLGKKRFLFDVNNGSLNELQQAITSRYALTGQVILMTEQGNTITKLEDLCITADLEAKILLLSKK